MDEKYIRDFKSADCIYLNLEGFSDELRNSLIERFLSCCVPSTIFIFVGGVSILTSYSLNLFRHYFQDLRRKHFDDLSYYHMESAMKEVIFVVAQ